jgi:hypothetical protein
MIAFLADRCEGNLFAAKQEIASSARCCSKARFRTTPSNAPSPMGPLRHPATLGPGRGDPRALAIIESLETEGEGLPLLMGSWGKTCMRWLRSAGRRRGTPMAVALRNARVWAIARARWSARPSAFRRLRSRRAARARASDLCRKGSAPAMPGTTCEISR